MYCKLYYMQMCHIKEDGVYEKESKREREREEEETGRLHHTDSINE